MAQMSSLDVPAKSASTMPLLSVPFAFSQVPLLSSDKFRDEAKQWGQPITLNDLQDFFRLGLLVPFYRADDDVQADLVATPHSADHSLPARYAREGRLRDPAEDDDPTRWPHLRPDNAPDRWWDGFLYSKWQLLGLRDAATARQNMRHVPDLRPSAVDFATTLRHEHIALAALSARSFPSIVGQVTLSDGAEWETLYAARRDIDSVARLAVATFPYERLQPAAEHLLSRAHSRDPMREWWDLIRHSDHSGWFRMRDGALEAIWLRISAEVLLRAHEELAEDGKIGPLPDYGSSPSAWSPLLDRIGAQPHSDGLQRGLQRVGLSPQPRVVLVLEGETERLQIPALLAELNIANPRHVQILKQGTSSDWPNQLARFVAPQLGRIIGNRQLVESATALLVAMDAEGPRWGTEDRREQNRRKLQRIVLEEVEAQGGTLTQGELDVLIQVRSWGDQKYELANFTDDELEVAMVFVSAPEVTAADETVWRAALREALAYARRRHLDIEIVFQRMQWPIRKLELARTLLPVLLDKLEHDDAEDHVNVPAIQLAYDLYQLVEQMSGSFGLETPAGELDQGE
jgi:hypothetical protein